MLRMIELAKYCWGLPDLFRAYSLDVCGGGTRRIHSVYISRGRIMNGYRVVRAGRKRFYCGSQNYVKKNTSK